jgi:threonine dehydratase
MATPQTILYNYFSPTRLIRSELLSTGDVTVNLKLEGELPTGSFKVRGALYALSRRMERGGVKEVVAASTGNHGAAVAWAAKQLGVRARIFLPVGANPAKVDKIRALGAAITEDGTLLSEAISGAEIYAGERDAYLLADAVDRDVPVGAGTIGSEILEQLPEVDCVYVPVGDTALARGVGKVLKTKRNAIRVIGVQAERAPAYYLSFKHDRIETTDTADTIADGLATTQPLEPNVMEIRRLLQDVVLISEEEMIDAIRALLYGEHVVIEPAGAASVAAFRRYHTPEMGKEVVLLLTGSNVAPDVLARAAAAR